MTATDLGGCRSCGGPAEPTSCPRGGRPRQYCLACRPSKTAERRRNGSLGHYGDGPCRQCGAPLDRSEQKAGRPQIYCDACVGRRTRPHRDANTADTPGRYPSGRCPRCDAPVDRSHQRKGRPRIYCDACLGHHNRSQRRARSKPHPLDDVRITDILGNHTTRVDRAVLERLFDLAHVGRWSAETLLRTADQARRVLAAHPGDEPVRLSQVCAELGSLRKSRIVARVLNDCGLLVDDTESRVHQWINRRIDTLPTEFRDDVRAWLVALHEGGARARPRAEAALHAYYSRVHPVLIGWAATRSHLREITRDDVSAVLKTMTGHRRTGTFVALRSLFRFAKRHRLVFVDPTRRLHAGRAPRRSVLPMTAEQVDIVTTTAVTPLQRVTVALVAFYAVRAIALRHLVLDDVDLSSRRIRIDGTVHQLTEFTHAVLTDWLSYRHSRWPHTSNQHVIVTSDSVLGTGPVDDYHLTWHLSLLGIQLEQIRADRVLQEALSVDSDPLYLALAFGLSERTAVDYSMIARTLIEQPIEVADGRATD